MGIFEDIGNELAKEYAAGFKSLRDDLSFLVKNAKDTYVDIGKLLLNRLEKAKREKPRNDREKQRLKDEIENIKRETEYLKNKAKKDPPGNANGPYKPWGSW